MPKALILTIVLGECRPAIFCTRQAAYNIAIADCRSQPVLESADHLEQN